MQKHPVILQAGERRSAASALVYALDWTMQAREVPHHSHWSCLVRPLPALLGEPTREDLQKLTYEGLTPFLRMAWHLQNSPKLPHRIPLGRSSKQLGYNPLTRAKGLLQLFAQENTRCGFFPWQSAFAHTMQAAGILLGAPPAGQTEEAIHSKGAQFWPLDKDLQSLPRIPNPLPHLSIGPKAMLELRELADAVTGLGA